MKLEEGKKAPDFQANNQDGQERTMKDYQGQWLLLYFYPKDFTSGCTKEACSFRDNWQELKKLVQVVGVSGDSVASHQKFQSEHKLPFELLADADRIMVKAYGANGILFPKRVSFLIDPNGTIQKIYRTVKPDRHAAQVLSDIANLISGQNNTAP